MKEQIVVELKKKPLQIYLTDEQKLKLKKIAAKEGLAISEA